jgi:hypothetical protein
MFVESAIVFPIRVLLITHIAISMTQIEVIILAYYDYVRACSLNSMPCNLLEIYNGACSHDPVRRCSCFVQETLVYLCINIIHINIFFQG